MSKTKRLFTTLLAVLVLAALVGCSGIKGDATFDENAEFRDGDGYWSASYQSFDGVQQQRIKLEGAQATFDVDVVTKGGGIGLSIVGGSGTEYYNASNIESTSIQVEVTDEERVDVQVEGAKHQGSYDIRWTVAG